MSPRHRVSSLCGHRKRRGRPSKGTLPGPCWPRVAGSADGSTDPDVSVGCWSLQEFEMKCTFHLRYEKSIHRNQIKLAIAGLVARNETL